MTPTRICKVNGFLAVLQEHIFYNVDWIDVSRETEIGISKQEASPSAGVNTGVVLVSCLRMEVHPWSYFRWCGYFWSPWVSLVTTDGFSVRVTKTTSAIGVSWVPLRLRYWCFPGKYMNFSVVATGGVLWKKLFLKISQYSQKSFRPATLLKRDSNTDLCWEIFKNTCFEKHLLRAACFFQTSTEQLWATVSVLTLLLSSDNTLTGYEQLSYWELNRNLLSICISLAKD